MDKRPQRLAKNTTDLMPKNASCKRWDTLGVSFNMIDRVMGLVTSWH